MTVDVFGLIFRIYDRLIFIQSIITGNGIADGNCDQIIGNTTESEELKCDQDRGDRAVGNATEKGCHSGGCTDGWGKTDQVSHDTSECCSDAEGRNNLTATETGAHGQGSEYELPEKVQRASLTILDSKFDQVFPAPI